MSEQRQPAVWFPTIRTDSGSAVFTERLVDCLRRRGLRAEIAWLPHHTEFAPWCVSVPEPPSWANVTHVNTWLHPRFLPGNMPVVATLHHAMHQAELRRYKGWLRSLYHQYWFVPTERRTMLRADSLVAVSLFAAEAARRTQVDRPIPVIHNGVDVEKFRPPAQRSSNRRFRLLYIGKWAPLKGVDLLAPIMRMLGEGFELRYTGGEEALSGRAGMPGNTHDLGRLHGDDAVVAAMHDADILIFPSRSEGFGLVAAEAMACGLPVVATRGSSLPEVVDDGVTGILCRQDDVVAFAAAIRALADDEGKRTSMSQAARQRAVDALDQNLMVDAYVRLYNKSLKLSMLHGSVA
ncbi:glycosyltransferase family 4 protein [Rhodanobacter sp. MP1X3]|uniref:glycosyltransferase family 4 protein n=1 Tax=Rhodanobacter sp. MP1X3 TaxID=2723086 RepID=UPI00184B57AA|nr:glycosyltransferase family 4 protein [Rhodanobacter sp. MP1X3]MBB6242325.1 glycosyltransferase involved in cell wall biosynthesis [Rhodanobacter sp. MP1X3]